MTERLIDSTDTLKRILPYRKKMGITRLANITGLDYIGIPVYVAIRPNSRAMAISQGKGLINEDAKVSALMETIESFHAEAIEESKIESFSDDKQYLSPSLFPRFKKRICKYKIKWIKGRCLRSEKNICVPYDIVHTDFRVRMSSLYSGFFMSSNGLASGNSIEEAVLYGLLELIERDSYYYWSQQDYLAQKKTKIILNDDLNLECKKILAKFDSANLKYGVWDISSDLGIPTFLTRIISGDPPPYSNVRPAVGMASHIDKNIALKKSLLEATQARLTHISGSRDDQKADIYNKFNLSSEEYFKWENSIKKDGVVRFKEIYTYESKTVNDNYRALLEKLFLQGITKVYSVNLSKEEYGIPVTRVVCPQMQIISNNQSVIRPYVKRAGQ